MARTAATPSMRIPKARRLGVIIVDPLPVVRAGLRLLVDDRPDMEVLADVGTSDDALGFVGKTRRNRIVILVGLTLQGERDAYWLIRSLREHYPGHATLAIGANADPSTVSRALFVGADGFADLNVDPVGFLSAIRTVAAGEMVLATPPSVSIADVARGIDRRRQIGLVLTDREREVLEVASQGLTAREIAERLGVRERTVTTHLARIYGKLGVGNRISAISVAARSGLVSMTTSN